MIVGGGWRSVRYAFNSARKIGFIKLITALQSKNACKTCAFGTGGQRGGIHNESNSPIEICNKNIQAHLTDIQPAIPDEFFKEHSIDELRNYKLGELERLGRLVTPLYKQAGDDHYQPLDYATAMSKIIARMRQTPAERCFFYTSGRSSNEAAFMLQLFARLYGTNNVNNCSYYCHQASSVGLNSTLGTGTATVQFQDLEKADLILVFGANPASNHPRFVKSLMMCRRRGGQVVVVNPIEEAGLVRFSVPSDLRSLFSGGDAIASMYVQPHIGGDIALIKGVAKYLIERDYQDKDFVENYSSGFSQFKRDIETTSWQDIIQSSGVTQDDIVHLGNLISDSRNAIFSWGMGLTQHIHGVDNVESIANLAILTGMLGRPGCGLLPLRGHSNVQGVGSMGVTPKLKQALLHNIESDLGIKLPTEKGLDTMACMQAALKGDFDMAVLLGGNLYAANPDTQFSKRALNNIPLKIYVSSCLNQGHVNGVGQEIIILPVAVRDEERQATTQESMFNFVRLSDGKLTRFNDVKSETNIVCDIGSGVIDKDQFDFAPFKNHKNIRQLIAKMIPGFEKIDSIDKKDGEFQIKGRTFHAPHFATKDAKAHFRIVPMPRHIPQSKQYQMMTLRSEGQFNTIIYEQEDVYRDQTERWVVLMNPEDMVAQGLEEDDKITLVNKTGNMRALKVKPMAIRKGNIATYYPEANALVPTDVDQRSKTPGFKSVAVSLQKDV
jgi:molybdopterin-dependent oxidoreductase alpha subunit